MAFIIVILIGLLIWAVLSSKMDALSKSVIYIYIGFWGIVLFFSSLNLLHFNTIQHRTYYMLLLHLFAFVIGYILVKIPKSHALVGVKSDYLGKQVEHLVNSKWYRILLIILTLTISGCGNMANDNTKDAKVILGESDFFQSKISMKQ